MVSIYWFRARENTPFHILILVTYDPIHKYDFSSKYIWKLLKSCKTRYCGYNVNWIDCMLSIWKVLHEKIHISLHLFTKTNVCYCYTMWATNAALYLCSQCIRVQSDKSLKVSAWTWKGFLYNQTLSMPSWIKSLGFHENGNRQAITWHSSRASFSTFTCNCSICEHEKFRKDKQWVFMFISYSSDSFPVVSLMHANGQASLILLPFRHPLRMRERRLGTIQS